MWRERDTAVAENAGRALLSIGTPDAVAAVAADVHLDLRRGSLVAIEAAFTYGGREAFERIDPLGEARPFRLVSQSLWHVRMHPELAAQELRWLEVGLSGLTSTDRSVAESARGIRCAARDARRPRSLLARDGPLVGAPRVPEEAVLAKARAEVAKIAAKLPQRAWTAAKQGDPRLAELDAITGGLPAWARAAFERFDGIDLGAAKSKDRYVLYPLATPLAEARRWDAEHAPRETAATLVPRLVVSIAPDGYEKAGLSGGPSLGFEAPVTDDDPILVTAPGKPKLSTFLKRAARAGAR